MCVYMFVCETVTMCMHVLYRYAQGFVMLDSTVTTKFPPQSHPTALQFADPEGRTILHRVLNAKREPVQLVQQLVSAKISVRDVARVHVLADGVHDA